MPWSAWFTPEPDVYAPDGERHAIQTLRNTEVDGVGDTSSLVASAWTAAPYHTYDTLSEAVLFNVACSVRDRAYYNSGTGIGTVGDNGKQYLCEMVLDSSSLHNRFVWLPSKLPEMMPLTLGVDYDVIPGRSSGDQDAYVDYESDTTTHIGWAGALHFRAHAETNKPYVYYDTQFFEFPLTFTPHVTVKVNSDVVDAFDLGMGAMASTGTYTKASDSSEHVTDVELHSAGDDTVTVSFTLTAPATPTAPDLPGLASGIHENLCHHSTSVNLIDQVRPTPDNGPPTGGSGSGSGSGYIPDPRYDKALRVQFQRPRYRYWIPPSDEEIPPPPPVPVDGLSGDLLFTGARFS